MKKSLGVLWLIVFVDLVGFGVASFPINFVVEQMGAASFWKTFAGSGVFSLLQFLSAPLWGRASDAYGRKPILFFSMLGSALAYIGLMNAHSLEALVVARALGGIMSGNISAAFAYATDVTGFANRAKGLGVVGSAFGLGFAVGPALGGYLGVDSTGQASMFYPALLSAVMSSVACLGVFLFLQESLPVGSRKPWSAPAKATGAVPAGGNASSRMLFAQPKLLALIAVGLIVSVGAATMQTAYPFWARDTFGFQLPQIGLQFLLLALLSAAGQGGLVGPVVKRLGEKGAAMLSIAGLAVGLSILAMAHQTWEMWLGLIVFGAVLGLFTPTQNSLVSFQAEPNNRGAVMGFAQSASSLGRIIGPAISGPVYDGAGHFAPFMLAAALAVMGGLMLTRVPRQQSAPAVAASGAP